MAQPYCYLDIIAVKNVKAPATKEETIHHFAFNLLGEFVNLPSGTFWHLPEYL